MHSASVCARAAMRRVASVAAAAAAPRVQTTARPLHSAARTMLAKHTTIAAAAAATKTAASASTPVANKHPRIQSQRGQNEADRPDKNLICPGQRAVHGELLSQNLDLSQASIGQTIDVPYETTIGESQQVLWMSTFQIHDRIYTSSPFAQLLHLPSHVLPFYMILFKAISMGHVDETREVLDIGFEHATYVRPAYAGDTLKQHFTIKHLKNTSNGLNTIVTVGCELTNQRNQLIFSVDKQMLFPGVTAPSHKISPKPAENPEKPRSHLLSHILYNSDNLPTTNSLAQLRQGQLLLHSTSRPVGAAMNMSLSTLFRWAHPSIYNMKRYKEEEIVVPGGLILAGTIAASSRGLFETLSESLDSCFFLNKVSPIDLIGGISFVNSIKPLKEGIEEVRVTTLGLKNLDVTRELIDVSIPEELFTKQLHRKQVEALVQEYCPILAGKIVVKAVRTIVRQSPYALHKNIPLL